MIFIKKIVLIMNVCCKVNYVKLFAWFWLDTQKLVLIAT